MTAPNRQFAPYTINDVAGAPGRPATQRDAGAFPAIPWFYSVQEIAPSDPGLDRFEAAVVVSSAVGDAYVITATPAPTAGFVVPIYPSGQWRGTLPAGPLTKIQTGIPWDDRIQMSPTFQNIGVVVNEAAGACFLPDNAFNDNGFVSIPLPLANPNPVTNPQPVAGDTVDVFMGMSNLPSDASAAANAAYGFQNAHPLGYARFIAAGGEISVDTPIPWTDYWYGSNRTDIPSWRRPNVLLMGDATVISTTAAEPYTDVDGVQRLRIRRTSGTFTAGQVVFATATRIQSEYVVPGTGPKRLRVRVRGFFERIPITAAQGHPVPTLRGTPSDALWSVTSLAGGSNSYDRYLIECSTGFYCLNGRQDPVIPSQPLFARFDYLADIPVTGGETVKLWYDGRPQDRWRTAIPVYNRDKQIPADDDASAPLAVFDPEAPLAGIAGQVDILAVLEP